MSKRILLGIILAIQPGAAWAQLPVLKLDHLNNLTNLAQNVVDVALDSAMLQTMSGLLSADNPNDAAAKALLAGLKGVYVKSLEFEREGLYSDGDLDALRVQFKAPWAPILRLTLREDRERVEAYIWRENNQPGGLAVVITKPKELTVVNVVGRIDLSQLGKLSSVLKIPRDLGAIPGAGGPKP